MVAPGILVPLVRVRILTPQHGFSKEEKEIEERLLRPFRVKTKGERPEAYRLLHFFYETEVETY